MTYDEFKKIPSTLARETIMKETFAEIQSGVSCPHSLQTIVTQNRKLGLACRMFGKGEIYIDGDTSYTGKEVADVFINSVVQSGQTYYPISGDWRKTDVKYLTLFVKDPITKDYQPYAKFDIKEVVHLGANGDLPKNSQNFTPVYATKKPTLQPFYSYFNPSSLLLIDNVQTKNLPTDYLGVTSGVSVKERAFKGSSPNIIII